VSLGVSFVISRSRMTLAFLVFFGFLSLSVPQLFAQAGNGRILGQLRLENGDVPPYSVLVELQVHESTLNSAYTDDHGQFGFFDVDAAPYHLVINDSAFKRVDQLVNVGALAAGFDKVLITLAPRDVVKQASDRAPGSNPYMVDAADYFRHFPKIAVKEFDRGVRADREGKYDDAIRHYQKAVEIAPSFHMAHNNLGSDYLRESNFPAAKSEFQKASVLNQSDGGPHFNLSNVCILTGELSEAQVSLLHGMQRQPNSALGYFLQGTLDLRRGSLPQAENSLRQAIQLDATMPQARLQLVNLLLQEGRRGEAVAQAEDFVAVFPESPFSEKVKDLVKRLQGPALDSQPAPKQYYYF
jgi:hypothetical protein